MRKDRRSYYKAWYRAKRQAIIDQLGGKCSVCGRRESLEIHHDEPLGYRGNRHHTWADLSKLKLFCHNCHVAYHFSEGEKSEGSPC